MPARRLVVPLLALVLLAALLGAATARAAAEVGRVAGPSRFATSVAIAQRAFPDGADTVYLARGDAFADALAAGTLTDGPVLLVPSCGEPPPETPGEIARLNPDTVIALGGQNAVCHDLLATLAAGRATDRLAAPDRFGTAAAIAARAFPDGADVAYVANAADSPDAVAGGALVDGPILLVPADGQPPETVTATLDLLDPATVVALGGVNAVAEDTLTATAAGRPTARVAGPSRFDTAAAIAARAFPPDQSPATVYLARGDVFADAVASGSLTDGPVLLVGSCGPLPDAVVDYLTQAAAGTVAALGGTQAVCDQVLTDAAALPDGATPTPSPEPTPAPTPGPDPTPTPDPSGATELFYTWTSTFTSYRFDTTLETAEFYELGEAYTMTPDGSQYLWEEDNLDDEYFVNWHDVKTNEQIDSTQLPVDFTLGSPRASPGGELISFQTIDYEADDDSRPLLIVDREGDDVLDDDPDSVGTILGTGSHVWSPQGELYVTLKLADATPVLGRLTPDFNGVQTIKEFPSFETLPTNLAVSPDGTQMLYTYLEHLYRIDLVTGEHLQLTTSNFEESEAAFSPDGSQIVFKMAFLGSVDSGRAYVIPNGEYPEPVRIQAHDRADEVPAGAPYTLVADDEGEGVAVNGAGMYWFPAR